MTDKEFIATIAPYVRKYCKEYGYWVASPIIAQACVESAYGRSSLASKYGNLFVLKCGSGWTGKSVNMSTNEEYMQGTLTTIRDNFRVYQDKTGKADWEAGVKGYFDFIQYPRYSNLRSATTPKQYLEYIKADGYATAYTYVNTCLRVVNQYNLEQYDGEIISDPKVNAVSYGGTVTADALRVRKGPGTGYEIVKVGGHDFLLPKGICIAFEAECNRWAKLAGVDGWCSLDYIKH